MLLKYRLPIVSLIVAQLYSCALIANPAVQKVGGDLVGQVLIECFFGDCFAKSVDASENDSGQSLMQAIQDYYALINQEKYETAWNHLSPGFQSRSEEKRGGYESYAGWWETVDSVSIKHLELVEGSIDPVYVDATLKYFKTDRKQFTHILRLSFIWDSENDRWAVDSSKVIDESPSNVVEKKNRLEQSRTEGYTDASRRKLC